MADLKNMNNVLNQDSNVFMMRKPLSEAELRGSLIVIVIGRVGS